jgi:hypothetical protein
MVETPVTPRLHWDPLGEDGLQGLIARRQRGCAGEFNADFSRSLSFVRRISGGISAATLANSRPPGILIGSAGSGRRCYLPPRSNGLIGGRSFMIAHNLESVSGSRLLCPAMPTSRELFPSIKEKGVGLAGR